MQYAGPDCMNAGLAHMWVRPLCAMGPLGSFSHPRYGATWKIGRFASLPVLAARIRMRLSANGRQCHPSPTHASWSALVALTKPLVGYFSKLDCPQAFQL